MTIRVFSPSDVQNGVESLLVNHQDSDTTRMIMRTHVLAPEGHFNKFEFVRPDRDAIQLGPIVDNGNGKFTCFATIQVEIEVKPEE